MAETNFDNMSVEELAAVEAKLKEAKEKRKLGDKYLLHKAIDDVLKFLMLPTKYAELIKSYKELEPSQIIPAVMDNDKILRFPMLMALAAYLPCSDIEVRCGLVELFDSYVYHSDFGLVVSNLAPFDVDRALRNCRAHDPLVADQTIYAFYTKLGSLMNNPISEGESRVWIKKAMDDLTYILQVIRSDFIPYRFIGAIQFMKKDNEICELNDEKAHQAFVEKFQDNGSDLLYARRIASAFKL